MKKLLLSLLPIMSSCALSAMETPAQNLGAMISTALKGKRAAEIDGLNTRRIMSISALLTEEAPAREEHPRQQEQKKKRTADEKPHFCSECPKRYTSLRRLNEHRELCHEQSDYNGYDQVILHCNAFESKPHPKLEVNFDKVEFRQEKEFECRYCAKGFNRSESCINHETTCKFITTFNPATKNPLV